MDNLPTAESILRKHLIAKLKTNSNSSEDRAEAINLAMIEHTKIYVEAALKIASEKAKTKSRKKTFKASSGSEYDYIISVDKKSILNAFPLTDIK